MFESVDIVKRESRKSDTQVVCLFVIISASYMLPWTAVGSLLHYFAGKYGDHFYVYLNVAFYGIGLPLSYSQKKFDTFLDTMYGSKFMFRRRQYVATFVLFLSLFFGPIVGEYGTLAIVIAIGLGTWAAHGCTSTLASMVKMNSSTMQQIGFAFPGVYSIIMVNVLDMEGDVSKTRLEIFYYTTALCVLPGIISWYILCRSDIVREALLKKDEMVGSLIINRAAAVSRAPPSSPQKVHVQSPVGAGWPNGGTTYAPLCQNDDCESSSPGNIPDINVFSCDRSAMRDWSTVGSSSAGIPSSDPTSQYHPKRSFLDYWFRTQTEDIIHDSRQLLKEGNGLHIIKDAIDGDDITGPILLHRWTLFLTIFISILQGALLSYTCGCTLFGMALPPLLYFVRIFADLVGRPLALLPKPHIFNSIRGVFYGSILRCIASIYFFYVVHTISPHASLLKNTLEQSLGLTLFQGAFSLLSGYFNCLTYEYAAGSFHHDWQRMVAAQYLNLTFQKACAAGVASAIAIVLTVDYCNPCIGNDFC